MAARGIALAAVVLLAAGCGGQVYSDATARNAAGSPSGYNAQVIDATPDAVATRRDNLGLVGPRAAVAAALRRLH